MARERAEQSTVVVRIKRKREERSVEDLLVAGIPLPVNKRAAVLQQLARLHVQGHSEDADQDQEQATVLKFRRVDTILTSHSRAQESNVVTISTPACDSRSTDMHSLQQQQQQAADAAPGTEEAVPSGCGNLAGPSQPPGALPWHTQLQLQFLGGRVMLPQEFASLADGRPARCVVYDLATECALQETPAAAAARSSADIHPAAEAPADGAIPQPRPGGVGDVVDGKTDGSDGMVIDVYELEDSQEGLFGGPRWMTEQEAHARYGGLCAALVRVEDPAQWLVAEGEEGEDSEVDSQDSNAEGYYANSYPDEDAWPSEDESGLGKGSDLSCDDEEDADRRMQHGGSRGRRGGYWDDVILPEDDSGNEGRSY